jgi:hypothetical protein
VARIIYLKKKVFAITGNDAAEMGITTDNSKKRGRGHTCTWAGKRASARAVGVRLDGRVRVRS